MITDLRPYSESKPSNLPWVGDIPSHWKTIPNRAFLKRSKVLVGDRHSDYALLSLTKQGVIVRDLTKQKGKFSSDMGTSQQVRQGDLVCCLFDVPETPRTIGLSRFDGMITGAYTVFECNDPTIAAFIERFYIAMDDRKLLGPLYSGLRNTIPCPVFLGTKTPVPPPDEQVLIVRFLDWASVRLGKAIAAKRKVIGLLEEQKQAIIHRAVTRGLDDTVPLKPSGLDWLGDVPEHWEVLRAGALFSERKECGRVGLPMLVVSLNTGVTVAGNLDHRGREKRLIADVEKYSFAKRGEIAYNMMRLWQGAVGVVPRDGLVSPAYVVAKPRASIANSQFYEFVFRTDECKGEVNRQSTGIVPDRNRCYWDTFKQLKLPAPPTTEQAAIVNGIEARVAPLLRVTDSLKREIELLREYRTRLISDVVTGKQDVREFAKSLTEEVSEEAAELATTEALDEEFVTDDELIEEAV